MESELVKVEQVDRDAAAALAVAMGFSRDAGRDITEGHKDYTPIVQAFARFRIALQSTPPQ